MRIRKLLLLSLSSFILTGCGLSDLFGGDTDTIHKSSYEPITGKFVLYDALDKRYSYTDTYFDIDGSKGNFSLKYYENGQLKKEGQFQRIVTYEDKIGKIDENLHFNVKIGNTSEHIGTYTECFDPIDQFRIVEEYSGSDSKYYLSELPFVMGTYVREGKEYKKETLKEGETNYLTPSKKCFTNGLNGYYKLDDEHYFYFLAPGVNDLYAYAFFQYYSPSLEKPLEGFVEGKTYSEPEERTGLFITYSRKVLFDKVYQDKANEVMFGYYSFDDNDNMIDHWGTVDFSDGEVKSLSFEHLSRNWTDQEWDLFTKDESYHMPDPIIYEYVGGTYTKQ